MRISTLRKILVAAVTAAVALALLGGSPATAAGGFGNTAAGTVFFPNPVTQTGDESLVDAKDADLPAFASSYKRVTLTNLDSSGTLTGQWVRVKSNTGTAARTVGGRRRTPPLRRQTPAHPSCPSPLFTGCDVPRRIPQNPSL